MHTPLTLAEHVGLLYFAVACLCGVVARIGWLGWLLSRDVEALAKRVNKVAPIYVPAERTAVLDLTQWGKTQFPSAMEQPSEHSVRGGPIPQSDGSGN